MAVMNFRVLLNVGNFLTGKRPVRFSRRTLLHGVSSCFNGSYLMKVFRIVQDQQLYKSEIEFKITMFSNVVPCILPDVCYPRDADAGTYL